MAGHSHFKNIKRKKEATDKKRASTFSRISKLIIAAVKEKGKDPSANPSLRIAIEKARESDMPKENIERAIKRGAGESDSGKALEPFLLEAYGPHDVAIIIEGSTDNKNRNLGDIKEILKKNNGKLADPGSVKWLFDQIGMIEIEKDNFNDELSLQIIEEGVDDIEEKEDLFLIYTPVSNLENIKNILIEKEINIISSRPGWRPKTKLPSPEDSISLIEELENYESVEGVYLNI